MSTLITDTFRSRLQQRPSARKFINQIPDRTGRSMARLVSWAERRRQRAALRDLAEDNICSTTSA